jgi:serine phosphatase RsbU (regulator of sigma subunit)
MPNDSTATTLEARHCNSLPGLNRLLAVTRVLAEEMDLAQILDTIVREASIALHCDRAILYQFDGKRNVLFGTAGATHELIVSLDRGIAGHVARSRTMVNVVDPAHDRRWDAAYDQQAGYNTQTVLAVPLVAARDSRLLGVLELLNNVGGPFDRDDEALALAFSHHAAAALDRARLIDEIQCRRELEISLQAAREVQRRFMPSKLPTISGYEVATWWFPNEAVGGDYCDVIPLPSGQTAFCIADVSGHGLGPSLLMASVRAALRTLLLTDSLPNTLLAHLADALAEDFQHGSFITMFLGLLDPSLHQLEFANAGHGPVLHYRAKTGGFEQLQATGLPLGVIIPTEYPAGPPQKFESRDLLLLVTDGIIEAMDSRGEQFGVERLQKLVQKLAAAPIQELARGIGREVELHYVGDSPPDDLTVLALRRQ